MDSKLNLVSVVIPAFNCAQYIQKTIESILLQTYKNIEVIIVDDGSTDNTRKQLVELISSQRIKYFFQDNKGPAAARNTGIAQSSGEYVAFLDADDLWALDKLEKSLGFLIKYKFDWICTAMIKMDQGGNKIIKKIPEDSGIFNSQTKEIKQLQNGLFFFSSVPVHTPTIMAKKKCFEIAGVFDESFLIGEDTDLWLRFEEANLRGGYLDEPLTIYNYNNKSLTKGKLVDGLGEHARVALKHARILGLEKEKVRKSYADFLWQIADRYYDSKRFFKVMKYTCLSIAFDTSNIKRLIKKLYKK